MVRRLCLQPTWLLRGVGSPFVGKCSAKRLRQRKSVLLRLSAANCENWHRCRSLCRRAMAALDAELAKKWIAVGNGTFGA
eukprot:10349855-Alexandrium_andersonii.AAC.1